MKQHEFGFDKSSYIYSRRPVKLEFYQDFNDVLQAIYFEKKIKGWTRAKRKHKLKGIGIF